MKSAVAGTAGADAGRSWVIHRRLPSHRDAMLSPNKSDQTKPQPRLRVSGFNGPQVGILCAALTLIISVPIWTHPLPPLSDYINHLSRMYAIANLPKNPLLANFYQINWQVIPNLVMDLVVPLLARVM